MSASEAAVKATQDTLGCQRVPNWAGLPICRTGPWGHYHGPWTDRGCAVAVQVADAVVAALNLTEETCCARYTIEDRVITCAESDRDCQTRLVGPWSEASS